MKRILILFILYTNIYNIVNAGYSNFYYWQCTWYVAKNKNVDWRGNAKDWVVNAKVKGYQISMIPKKGAIVVFSNYWYNRKYWHVAIVENIIGKYIIISEMNYTWFNEISYRKIIITKAVKGFIYI